MFLGILTGLAQTFDWVVGFGSNNDDYIQDMTIDNFGNVYIVSSFKNIIDFDPSPGVVNLIASNQTDVFIAKHDSAGNYIGAKK